MRFDWDAEVEELIEYGRVERELPHTCAGSRIKWGGQFLAGLSPYNGDPVHFPWRGLLTNALIEGRPGTGKTVIMDAWLAQALANPRIRKVVYVSYKKSPASVANVAAWAARAGRRCWFVTNEPGKASHGLPLLQSLLASGLPSLDGAAALVAGLSYHYGAGHGADYYREVKELALGCLQAAGELPVGQQTFAHLAKRVMAFQPPPEFADPFRESRTQLLKSFVALGAPDFLNCQEGADDRAMVDLREFFSSDEPEVLVLQLLPEVSTINSFLVPQLVTQLHGQVIQARGEESDEPRVLYFVDEAGNFFSNSVGHKLERFRSSGTGFVMAYQHPGQFKQGTNDYTAAIEGNTALKIYLGCESLDRLDYFKRFVGERMALTSQSFRSEHQPRAMDPDVDVEPRWRLPEDYYPLTTLNDAPFHNVVTEAVSNSVGPRPAYSDNDIFATFSAQNYGLMRSSFDRDFYQHQGTLVPVYFPFHTTPDAYERLRRTPWPSPPGARPVVYRDVLAEILRPPANPDDPKGNKKVFHGKQWADAIAGIHDQHRKPPKTGGGS